MELTKYIARNCIIPSLNARTKADALKELAHLLFDKRKMPEVGNAVDQIFAREITESTGIGQGLAVPHARVTGIKQLACAVGRVPKGLDFMAIDRKPVYIIFLICYPPAEQTIYLNFLATVVKLTRSKECQKALFEAESSDEIFDTLEQYSMQLVEQQEEHKAGSATAGEPIPKNADAHQNLGRLARLQMYQEMLDGTRTGKTELKQRIETIRTLIEPRILKHFDRLAASRPPALVAVEGDTCQGCFMKLPSKFVQQVRQDTGHIHTCSNCSRFIYVV